MKNAMKIDLILSFWLCLCFASVAAAEVKLPSVFADHMVIQRNLPVHVWGFSDPAEKVTVQFRGESREVAADALGRWQVSLPPGAAGGPFELEVRGDSVIHLSDVMVGDVWVASGQSNMGLALHEVNNAAAEIASANHALIRLFHVDQVASDFPLDDLKPKTSWTRATPQSVADFSAIGYLFARGLLETEKREGPKEDQKVAIGVIETDWGGTPAEAWTSMAALSRDAGLAPLFSAWASLTEEETQWRLEAANQQRAIAMAKSAGQPVPQFPWHGELRSWAPAALYNGMIAPLTPFPIRGVIWYQGESNSDPERAPFYARLFQTLIQDWRNRWGVGDFPLLFVQLANFKTGPDGMWATLRDQQRRALSLRNTAMAVTIDIGDPDAVHPKNKQDVAKRLVLAARSLAYGEKIEYSGPLFRQATREDHSLRVWFDHTADGLSLTGESVKGFEVAGADRKFFPATARIERETVIVDSEQVPSPAFVRYGWASNPETNLFNKAGLPASPFDSGR